TEADRSGTRGCGEFYSCALVCLGQRAALRAAGSQQHAVSSGQKSEVRDQMSEDRGQKAEDRRQKTEILLWERLSAAILRFQLIF
ncbi:MAG: hypothetical protein WBG91_21015, partial [Syntrophobacteria bacterium]